MRFIFSKFRTRQIHDLVKKLWMEQKPEQRTVYACSIEKSLKWQQHACTVVQDHYEPINREKPASIHSPKQTDSQAFISSNHQCQCFITASIVNGPLIFRLHSTSRRSVHVIRKNQNKTALRVATWAFLAQPVFFFSTRMQIYDR